MNDIIDRILFEDNHLLILNKRAGELVQGDKTGDKPLLELIKEMIKVRDHKPGNVYLGAPHRLDRPVSGIVIFAKTSKAMSRLSELFRVKEIKKLYWAIVSTLPKEPTGRLQGWMIKNERQNKSYVSEIEKPKHKFATLNYHLKAKGDRYHLLEVELETGRHHQIRAQLADMSCIIKGDLKYGSKRSNPDGSIGLHARMIQFKHPVTKKDVTISAPCPDDNLWNFFEQELS